MHLAALGELKHRLEHGGGRHTVRVRLEPCNDVGIQRAAALVNQLECRVLLAEREAVLHLQSVRCIRFGQLRLDRVLAAVDRLPDSTLGRVHEFQRHMGRVISVGEGEEGEEKGGSLDGLVICDIKGQTLFSVV